MDRSKRLSDEEVQRVLDTVDRLAQADIEAGKRGWPTDWPTVRMLVYMVLTLGGRVSEFASLTVDDIDFREGYLRTIPLKRRKRTGRMVTDPETGEKKPEWKPVREVVTDPMPDDLQAELADYLQWQHRVGIIDKALFVGKRGPLTAQGLQKAWKAAMIAAGLTQERKGRIVALYSVHKGRHTCAHRMLNNQDKNLPKVKRLLHHANVASTLVYLGASDDELRDAMTGLRRKE